MKNLNIKLRGVYGGRPAKGRVWLTDGEFVADLPYDFWDRLRYRAQGWISEHDEETRKIFQDAIFTTKKKAEADLSARQKAKEAKEAKEEEARKADLKEKMEAEFRKISTLPRAQRIPALRAAKQEWLWVRRWRLSAVAGRRLDSFRAHIRQAKERQAEAAAWRKVLDAAGLAEDRAAVELTEKLASSERCAPEWLKRAVPAYKEFLALPEKKQERLLEKYDYEIYRVLTRRGGPMDWSQRRHSAHTGYDANLDVGMDRDEARDEARKELGMS